MRSTSLAIAPPFNIVYSLYWRRKLCLSSALVVVCALESACLLLGCVMQCRADYDIAPFRLSERHNSIENWDGKMMGNGSEFADHWAIHNG